MYGGQVQVSPGRTNASLFISMVTPPPSSPRARSALVWKSVSRPVKYRQVSPSSSSIHCIDSGPG